MGNEKVYGEILGYYEPQGYFHRCNQYDPMIQSLMQHLDNRIGQLDSMPDQEDADMAKINRAVTINGEKRWIRANTEQEYIDKAAKLMRVSDQSEPDQPKHLFKDYSDRWFEVYKKPSDTAEATINLYSYLLRNFIYPVLGDMMIEDIVTDHVQMILNNAHDKSKGTKTKIMQVLNQILNAAIEDGIIVKNPAKSKRIKVTGKDTITTPPYTVRQMKYIVEHIADVKNSDDRKYLAIHSMHPLRLEEVLGLQWRDIDFENKAIHINRAVTHPRRNQPVIKSTKTEASVRPVWLTDIAASFLKPLQGAPDEFVVGGQKPISYTQVRRMSERIVKDISFGEKITPKRMRPTVLTDLYNKTKDVKLVQAAAGHTTAAMTMKHYVNPREDVLKAGPVIEAAYGIGIAKELQPTTPREPA